ncbi:hypothetical protein SKAU_G00324930 [Synaphobranchus kaupii]|uniref:Uncharacterized protein n=1 Tax=Synaphobranchus kaupii TaxID=118154 RepID=A0A9Q1EPI8_SYNKA|nr:hypothetical protein SKAU_G00324930 [Synaphobranchus kaupii]
MGRRAGRQGSREEDDSNSANIKWPGQRNRQEGGQRFCQKPPLCRIREAKITHLDDDPTEMKPTKILNGPETLRGKMRKISRGESGK